MKSYVGLTKKSVAKLAKMKCLMGTLLEQLKKVAC